MDVEQSVARQGDSGEKERVIATARLCYTAYGEDGEEAELEAIAALLEIEECFLIVEFPMSGEQEGERFVRAASHSPECIQGSWFRHTGGRVTMHELGSAA